MSYSAFEKRVRRRVAAREHEFFVVVPPGLEAVCGREFQSLPLSSGKNSPIQGGIRFQGKVTDCYLANLHLRCAGRVLMRIAGFKATNFRQLKKQISGIEWELYMYQGRLLAVHVTTRQSRLFHTSAVQEVVQAAVIKRLDDVGADPGADGPLECPQRIYIRINKDMVTVSMDSTGDLLYKRGVKTHRARAPIRETIAAAALYFSGYHQQKMTLVDPMCGSGTFSLEAAMMAARIPAGWYRRFAFENWPCFRSGSFQQIRRKAAEKKEAAGLPKIYASDMDRAAVRRLSATVDRFEFQNRITVSCRDYFTLRKGDFSKGENEPGPGLVVMNPPYGIRIGGKANSRRQFQEILWSLVQGFPGWRTALVVPREMVPKNLPLKHTRRYPVVHGGLTLTILTGRIPPAKR